LNIIKLIKRLELLNDIEIYSLFIENYTLFNGHIIHNNDTSLYFINEKSNKTNKVFVKTNNLKNIRFIIKESKHHYEFSGITPDEDLTIFKMYDQKNNITIKPLSEIENIPKSVKEILPNIPKANIILYDNKFGVITIIYKGIEIFVPTFNDLPRIANIIDNVYKDFFWNTIFEIDGKLIDSYGNKVHIYDEIFISKSHNRVWIGSKRIEIDNFNGIKSIHISKLFDNDLIQAELLLAFSDSLTSRTNKHLSSPLF